MRGPANGIAGRLAIGARIALVRAGFAIGSTRRRRRRVLLATAHADRLEGNLAAIHSELARRAVAPTVVLARAVRSTLRGRLRAMADHMLAGFHLATATLTVVDDYFFPMYVIRPRRGTHFIQTWHASGAFKKFGYSVGERAFGLDLETARRIGIHSTYDLCLVSAARFAPAYAEAFGLPIDRFTSTIGIPRTDVFFDAARVAEVRRAIQTRYALPEGRRVILYAPTFRGEQITSARAPGDLDIGRLAERLGDDHVLLLRDHPFVAARRSIPGAAAGFLIDASDHPDIHDLMLVSDVLVTDYSSAMYEFSLLERPIAFFAPDHAAYEAERGFYLEYATDLPGPVFETTDALADWLRGGDPDLDRIRRFRDASFDVADGRATARFVDEVVLPALR